MLEGLLRFYSKNLFQKGHQLTIFVKVESFAREVAQPVVLPEATGWDTLEELVEEDTTDQPGDALALLSGGEPVSVALHLLRLEILLNVTIYNTSGVGEFSFR